MVAVVSRHHSPQNLQPLVEENDLDQKNFLLRNRARSEELFTNVTICTPFVISNRCSRQNNVGSSPNDQDTNLIYAVHRT